MRIKSLYIEKYKNIIKQTFDFSNNSGYIALIGENGSGKTNLLEAISLIFNGLFNKKKIPFKYEFQYEHDGHMYLRKPSMAMKDGIKVKDSEMFYPTSVIACYSGEDLRLWHNAYEDYYMHYFNKAIRENYYVPELIYINKYCWEIALISLLCAFDKKDVNDFLSSCLNIKNIDDVTVSFYFDTKKEEMFKKHDALNWFRRLFHEGGKDINAKTLATMDIFSSSSSTQKQEKCKTIFQYLYLLSQPKRNDVNRVDKLITKIVLKIGDIVFEDLSEGEKKMILVECINKVLGDKNTLVLLDEPDAHTHIARKADILKTIKSFEGQTVLTTHSPIFIEMMDYNNLKYIENGCGKNMEKIKAITEISNNKLNILDGAIIASAKRLIVTEGPDDVKHVKKAIEALSKKDTKFEKLKGIPVVFQGGAKLVEEYYNSIISKDINNIEKVVFVFDFDSEGRDGAKLVEKIGNAKIDYVFYNKKYPITSTDYDFYLEDFYSASVYSDIKLPQIVNTPTYYQMKKMATLSKSIKEKLQKKIDNNQISENDFDDFANFFDELLNKFNI